MGSTPETRVCGRCGARIAASALDGLCPACLLQSSVDEPPADLDTRADSARAGPPPVPAHLSSFGDYELREEIARGGMGVVFKARQRSLNRTVAVKLLLFGRYASPEFAQRFRAEAAAAASLQHPNIVAIHEVGEHEGQPFFSMDFVAGRNLADLVHGQPLPPRPAARYLEIIARAIHYAHERAVLHRDLKPSNVLIDQFDQPRITDFGLAKRLPASELETPNPELTVTGQVLGSPAYMPPEQAAGKREALSPASDVYSLGAILFHLLTGRPPFVSESISETLEQVRHAEPFSPRLFNPGMPRDLETICLKCLEKEPSRRYQTAHEFAEELARFLRDEPIHARPVGPVYRLWRWGRRHPAIAGLSAALLLMLGTVAVTSTLAALRIARAEKGRVEKLRESYVAQAQAQRRTAEAGHRFRALDAVSEAARLNPPADLLPQLRSEAIAALALVDTRPLRVWPVRLENRPPLWLFNRGLDRYVRLEEHGAGKVLSLRRAQDDTELARAALGRIQVSEIAALSEDERFVVVRSPGMRNWVYDLSRGALAMTNAITGSVEFVRGTNLLAVFTPKTPVALWDVAAGGTARTIAVPPATMSAVFSPDGSRFALNLDRQVEVRDAATERTLFTFNLPASAFRLAWGWDNSRLIAVCTDRQAYLWRAETGEEVKVLSGAAGGIVTAALHSGARFILTTELDRTVRLWDFVRSKSLLTLPGSGLAVRFSADGQRFGPVLLGDTLALYEIVPPSSYRRLAPDMPETRSGELGWSKEGRLLAMATPGNVRFWDAEAGVILGTLAVPELSERAQNWWKVGRSRPVFFDAEGALWAEGGEELVRWPVRWATNRNAREVRVGPAEFIPFAASSNEWPRVSGAWVARSLQEAHTNGGARFAAVSPDGRYVAALPSVLPAASITVRDRKTGATFTNLAVQDARAAQFSPDGRWLVTAGRQYEVWDTAEWHRVADIDSRAEEPADAWAEFSPDGRMLALVRDGRQVDLRMADTRQPIATLEAPDGLRIEQIRFSRDNALLAASGREGSVQVWDLRAIAEQLADLRLDWPLPVTRATAWSGTTPPLRLKLIAAVPRRDPSAPGQLLDLSEHYNARLDEAHLGQSWTLAKLPQGVQTFDGVKFDARGMIQLSASRTRLPAFRFPAEVEGIAVRKALHRIHFLHGCINRVEPGTLVARYVVHFADGQRLEVPVVYGEAVRDTLFMSQRPTQAANASISWQGSSDRLPQDQALRLFHFAWTNPRPEAEVHDLDFVSTLSASAPFLVAITIE